MLNKIEPWPGASALQTARAVRPEQDRAPEGVLAALSAAPMRMAPPAAQPPWRTTWSGSAHRQNKDALGMRSICARQRIMPPAGAGRASSASNDGVAHLQAVRRFVTLISCTARG